MHICKNITLFLFSLSLLIGISNVNANEDVIGSWASPSGNIKFLTKNRYRGIIGDIKYWQYNDESHLTIDKEKYKYSVSNNTKTGMQFLTLTPIRDNENQIKIEYYRKIPTRSIDKKLLIAVQNNNSELSGELLENGANPYTSDYDIADKIPAHHLVVKSEDTRLIKIFLPYTQKFMQQAFFESVDNNDYAAADAFLNAGLNPNITDNLRTTPLMHAIALGNITLVKRLIEFGADINMIDGYGNTTKSYAIRAIKNSEKIQTYLFSHQDH